MAVPNKVIVPKNAHIPKTQAQAWARLPKLEALEGDVGDGRRDCVSRKRRKMFARSKVCSTHHLTSHIPAHQYCKPFPLLPTPNPVIWLL